MMETLQKSYKKWKLNTYPADILDNLSPVHQSSENIHVDAEEIVTNVDGSRSWETWGIITLLLMCTLYGIFVV